MEAVYTYSIPRSAPFLAGDALKVAAPTPSIKDCEDKKLLLNCQIFYFKNGKYFDFLSSLFFNLNTSNEKKWKPPPKCRLRIIWRLEGKCDEPGKLCPTGRDGPGQVCQFFISPPPPLVLPPG